MDHDHINININIIFGDVNGSTVIQGGNQNEVYNQSMTLPSDFKEILVEILNLNATGNTEKSL